MVLFVIPKLTKKVPEFLGASTIKRISKISEKIYKIFLLGLVTRHYIARLLLVLISVLKPLHVASAFLPAFTLYFII